MFRPNWKTLLIGAVLVTTLTIGGSTADATWGYHHHWSCSSCVTPYVATYSCDPCCDPCDGWYLGYRPGPIRRALFGPCRWYYGGCGTTCDWGCSTCDTFSGCCDVDVSGTPTEATPAEQATPDAPDAPTPAPPEAPSAPTEPEPPRATEPATPPMDMNEPPLPTTPSPMDTPSTTPMPPTSPAPTSPLEPFGNPATAPAEPPAAAPDSRPFPGAQEVHTPESSGLLTIWVPYDAKVKINGLTTKSVGSRRQYVSYGLKPGLEYRYEVLAEVVRDGRIYEEARTVTMTAGTRSAVAFGFNIPDQSLAGAY